MVIFVIAADEGVMPQTREHLDIIQLLGVNQGVVAITKKDMVDEEWLLLVQEEIQEYLGGSILKNCPLLPVSAVSGEGIEELLGAIESIAGQVQEKPVLGQVRLPIDRVFTVAGFGTVVTGTLWSGQLNLGDTLELMPVQRPVRVRTLQVHNEKVTSALAGQRVAVNLQGIEVSEIKRGYLLASPQSLSPSFRVDTRLNLLPGSRRTLKNWSRIRFHLGTDEALGRVVLLDRDELQPGEESYAQIVMEKPIVCQKGDPFVIRYYSPVTTIGGGTIIDPVAAKQKRFREEVLDQLVLKEEGSLYEQILQVMEAEAESVFNVAELSRKTASEEKQVKAELEQLLMDDEIWDIRNGEYISVLGLQNINDKITRHLKEYHQQYPLRRGYSKEDIRSRFFSHLSLKTFNIIIKYWEENGSVSSYNNQLRCAGYTPQPGEKENAAIQAIQKQLEQQPFSPPALEEIPLPLALSDTDLSEVINYMLAEGMLVKLSGELYFAVAAVEEGQHLLEGYFEREKELTLAAARDIWHNSRKYALPLLEYYDKIRFTRRVGDVRVKF